MDSAMLKSRLFAQFGKITKGNKADPAAFEAWIDSLAESSDAAGDKYEKAAAQLGIKEENTMSTPNVPTGTPAAPAATNLSVIRDNLVGQRAGREQISQQTQITKIYVEKTAMRDILAATVDASLQEQDGNDLYVYLPAAVSTTDSSKFKFQEQVEKIKPAREGNSDKRTFTGAHFVTKDGQSSETVYNQMLDRAKAYAANPSKENMFKTKVPRKNYNIVGVELSSGAGQSEVKIYDLKNDMKYFLCLKALGWIDNGDPSQLQLYLREYKSTKKNSTTSVKSVVTKQAVAVGNRQAALEAAEIGKNLVTVKAQGATEETKYLKAVEFFEMEGKVMNDKGTLVSQTRKIHPQVEIKLPKFDYTEEFKDKFGKRAGVLTSDGKEAAVKLIPAIVAEIDALSVNISPDEIDIIASLKSGAEGTSADGAYGV